MKDEGNMTLSGEVLALSYPFVYSDYVDEKGDYFGYMSDSYNPMFLDFTKVNKEINM
jgi:hypothetical protein